MAESEVTPLSLPPPLPAPVAEVATPAGDERFTALLATLARDFPSYSTARVLVVDATAQTLILVENGQAVNEWVISTATSGLGSAKGSQQTPLGVHRVAQKLGDGAPLGAIFKARQNTGRIAQILTGADERSTADNVTTRILWLDGLEPGVNKGGDVDSYERYIYIHGTDEEGRLGNPASHGCIRMRNADVIDLFNRVDEDTLVVITQKREG
ncbi:L,D-transpeptidase [Thiothrix subterranea]|uniref:L,D-transpeptidase n=1 Tax=Thiothrix subterranea TaxID=2735563 RepID=A0AA51MLA8_9GAMM|nr:L,D-transpeptidase [Thiothrix subterranea]MDQ5768817.1 L,D-transpeptidase [Thiothrix subterranea]WML86502.1 L,D-transpeptidase [Thiothrix subterranea]